MSTTEDDTNAAADGNAQVVHDWSAFYDDDGRIYYYNNVNGESSWDAPDSFNPPPESSAEANTTTVEDQPAEVEAPLDEVSPREATEADAAPPQQGTGDWVAYKDDEGREYFYNTVSEETTWDKPADFLPDTSSEIAEVKPSSPLGQASPVAVEKTSPSLEHETVKTPSPSEPTESPEPSEVVDPKVERLERAKEALDLPDAIMEPGVMAHLTEVVNSEGGNPQQAIQSLSESYYGQTAVCGLLGKWLADLKSQAVSSDSSDQRKQFSVSADEIRETAQGVVNRISKERFSKTGGDAILNLSRSEAAFLEDMMDSTRWRKLLIDLSASNKDSALLMYCLQAISKRGHHREIARRINQSDHFSVFNAMLTSEITVLGKIAVSSGCGNEASIGLDELVGDLQRTCTSTAYTYIYAIEVLRHLIGTAKARPPQRDEVSPRRFARAIRKWERLNEDLQSAMLDPTSAAGSTPLFRKRRLDVAVTISELHQRQRRRIQPSSDDAGTTAENAPDGNRSKLEASVLSFLRRYSLGTQIDDRILDAMLQDDMGSGSSNLIGKLLIRRPLTVKALLGYLYKPGSQRVSSVVTRNKCARLAALAVLAAEKEAVAEAKEVEQTLDTVSEEVELMRALLEGSKLCERIENMVSFIVAVNAGNNGVGSSTGEQLCSMAFKYAPVAQGVGIWAQEITKGSEFVSSASYPTLSPSILSLVRVVYLKHPFIGDHATAVAFGFLKHSNSEISYQKMNGIKEQSLRLLLFLSMRGEAAAVVGQVATQLNQPGTSGLDASLVRYFVSGLLEVANTPFSSPFLRLICNLLKSPGCIEAVKSSYFVDENKERLDGLLKYLRDVEKDKTGNKLSSDDTRLIASVVSIYSE